MKSGYGAKMEPCTIRTSNQEAEKGVADQFFVPHPLAESSLREQADRRDSRFMVDSVRRYEH
jgi:hypothetical protein